MGRTCGGPLGAGEQLFIVERTGGSRRSRQRTHGPGRRIGVLPPSTITGTSPTRGRARGPASRRPARGRTRALGELECLTSPLGRPRTRPGADAVPGTPRCGLRLGEEQRVRHDAKYNGLSPKRCPLRRSAPEDQEQSRPEEAARLGDELYRVIALHFDQGSTTAPSNCAPLQRVSSAIACSTLIGGDATTLCHGVERVTGRDDPGEKRDLLTREPSG